MDMLFQYVKDRCPSKIILLQQILNYRLFYFRQRMVLDYTKIDEQSSCRELMNYKKVMG